MKKKKGKARYRIKKSIKPRLIIAVILAAFGFVVLMWCLRQNGYDVSVFGTVRYQNATHTLSDSFGNINIDTKGADVEFVPSEDGVARVICYEPIKRSHEVNAQGGTLSVKMTDTRKWYDRINVFTFATPKITVYLPNTDYAKLSLNVSYGGVCIPRGYRFEGVEISGSRGDLRMEGASISSLQIDLTRADVDIRSLSCSGNLRINVTSGDVELDDVMCKNFTTTGKRGDVVMKDFVASEKLKVKRTKGDIKLENVDAAEITVQTTSGDVIGVLSSPKSFATKSKSGKVSVPYSVSGGGICDIKTKSGDIDVTYSNQ